MEDLNLSFDDTLKAIAKAYTRKDDPAIAYLEPNRIYHYMGILVPVGYKWQDTTVEYYSDDPVPMAKGKFYNLVFHGHGRKGTGTPNQRDFCTNRTYCHVYSYKPTGAESPEFIRNFNEKWKKLYAPPKPPKPYDERPFCGDSGTKKHGPWHRCSYFLSGAHSCCIKEPEHWQHACNCGSTWTNQRMKEQKQQELKF